MLMLLQVDGSLADLGWSQLGDSTSEGLNWAWLQVMGWIQAYSPFFFTAYSKGQWLHRGCCHHGRLPKGSRASSNTEVYLSFLLVSNVLKFHWPKQVTRPSPTSMDGEKGYGGLSLSPVGG